MKYISVTCSVEFLRVGRGADRINRRKEKGVFCRSGLNAQLGWGHSAAAGRNLNMLGFFLQSVTDVSTLNSPSGGFSQIYSCASSGLPQTKHLRHERSKLQRTPVKTWFWSRLDRFWLETLHAHPSNPFSEPSPLDKSHFQFIASSFVWKVADWISCWLTLFWFMEFMNVGRKKRGRLSGAEASLIYQHFSCDTDQTQSQNIHSSFLFTAAHSCVSILYERRLSVHA